MLKRENEKQKKEFDLLKKYISRKGIPSDNALMKSFLQNHKENAYSKRPL